MGPALVVVHSAVTHDARGGIEVPLREVVVTLKERLNAVFEDLKQLQFVHHLKKSQQLLQHQAQRGPIRTFVDVQPTPRRFHAQTAIAS